MITDTGWWIALERGERRVMAQLEVVRREGLAITTSAGVVAQVWRDGARQARVAALLQATDVVDLTGAEARRIGQLLGEHAASDAVDGHVALLAHDHPQRPVATGDRHDLTTLGVEATRIVEV